MHGNAAKNTHNVVLRELLARVSAGSVLDAPCGAGHLANRMSDAGLDVIGFDIDSPVEVGKFDFRHADLSATLPMRDGAVENLVSVEGVEHLERPFEFVRECNRVLVEGGGAYDHDDAEYFVSSLTLAMAADRLPQQEQVCPR